MKLTGKQFGLGMVAAGLGGGMTVEPAAVEAQCHTQSSHNHGPGQGYALWRQGLSFRPDWEHVITPVVDFALSRAGVDPKRIAIQGISQGGYWVPRAVAFEKRIATAVADTGVVDVSTSWTATLPPPMMELLKAGRKDEFMPT